MGLFFLKGLFVLLYDILVLFFIIIFSLHCPLQSYVPLGGTEISCELWSRRHIKVTSWHFLHRQEVRRRSSLFAFYIFFFFLISKTLWTQNITSGVAAEGNSKTVFYCFNPKRRNQAAALSLRSFPFTCVPEMMKQKSDFFIKKTKQHSGDILKERLLFCHLKTCYTVSCGIYTSDRIIVCFSIHLWISMNSWEH